MSATLQHPQDDKLTKLLTGNNGGVFIDGYIRDRSAEGLQPTYHHYKHV